MKNEPTPKYRKFTIEGRVYSFNESQAAHTVYWAIRNSDNDEDILIDDIQFEGDDNE